MGAEKFVLNFFSLLVFKHCRMLSQPVFQQFYLFTSAVHTHGEILLCYQNQINCIVDVNECVTTPNVCHQNAQCTNTEGSLLCSCLLGYTGDGRLCIGKTFKLFCL